MFRTHARLGHVARTLALVAILTVPFAAPWAAAWGNGCASCNTGYPYYGPHDAVADAALRWVRALDPARAGWIDAWFVEKGGDWGASFDDAASAPSSRDNWLAWTDDPDSSFRDWPNHLFIVHTRPGSEERGGPPEVQRRFDLAVENLTEALRLGGADGKRHEHRAAHHLGLAAHYVGDMSQFGHVDDTRRDHSRPAYDPLGRTYHGYYESVTWSSQGLSALDSALRASPLALDPVTDVAAEVEALARRTSALDGSTVRYRDSDGSTVDVGADYAWALDRYVAQYDEGTRYHGMRGFDAELWDHTMERQRDSVHLVARLVAEAHVRASAAANRAPTAAISDVPPTECAGALTRVALDGSGSSDPDGDALAYAWRAGGAEVEGATSARATALLPVGTTTVTLRVSDRHASDEAAVDAVVVDTTAPITTLTLAGVAGEAAWWRSEVDVALHASDACAATATELSVDGAPAAPAASARVAGEGAHAVRYRSTDAHGNAEPEREAVVRIDTVPPTTAAALDGVRGLAGWWRSPVAVTFAAEDATSGVAETRWRLDDGALTEADGPAAVRDDGAHRVSYGSTDVAGNAEALHDVEVRVDATPPASALALDGVPGRAGWWRSAVAARVSAADATSGIESVVLRVDGTEADGPATLVEGDGVHALAHRATDVAGNAEVERVATVRIDATPPATTAASSGVAGERGWWRSSVTVKLEASDATSGVAATRAGVDGAEPEPTADVIVEGDGAHVVTYASVDVAGNAEAWRGLEVRLDATPPTVTLVTPSPRSLYLMGERVPMSSAVPTTVVVGGLVVRADASDATSGLARVEFRVDGAVRHVAMRAPFEWAWDAGAEAAGEHTVEAIAFDVAGNAAAASLAVLTVPTSEAGAAASVPGA